VSKCLSRLITSIGTDIGGSIRNPAAHNGIYGFKPTSARLPKGGNKVCPTEA
jgi:amidase